MSVDYQARGENTFCGNGKLTMKTVIETDGRVAEKDHGKQDYADSIIMQLH